MFCFQCQETARNSGCTVRGVCGKSEITANLQDLLIFVLKGISIYGLEVKRFERIDKYIEDINTLLSKILKNQKAGDIKQIFIEKIPYLILFKSFDEEKIQDTMTFEEAEDSQFVDDLNKISDIYLDLDEIRENQNNDLWIQNFQEDYSASITKDWGIKEASVANDPLLKTLFPGFSFSTGFIETSD